MKKNLNLPKKKTGRLRNLFLTVCLLASVAASAQEKTVTGTVTDALGDPLIGATVLAVSYTHLDVYKRQTPSARFTMS